MPDTTVRVEYIGAVQNFSEVTITGNQQVWRIGSSAFVETDRASQLVASGKFRSLANDPAMLPANQAKVTASASDEGVGNRWDVPGISAAGHVVYSALPKLNGHLPADGRTYSISAFPTLAKRLGRISNGLSAMVARNSAADNNWYSVCWSPERALFVAVGISGTGNRVMTSPDGITWTARNSAADVEWIRVCWADGPGVFIAVAQTGSGNRVMTSPDGITWAVRPTPADNSWSGICWSQELSTAVAVAQTGTGNRVMTAYGCTYNPLTDFAVPKITAPAGCYAHILAG